MQVPEQIYQTKINVRKVSLYLKQKDSFLKDQSYVLLWAFSLLLCPIGNSKHALTLGIQKSPFMPISTILIVRWRQLDSQYVLDEK